MEEAGDRRVGGGGALRRHRFRPRQHRGREQWYWGAEQLRPKLRKLTMDAAELDVPAYMAFTQAHRAKLHSTHPIERLNGEIKRRTNVVGIVLNEDTFIRLIDAILLKLNDEWTVMRASYVGSKAIAPMGDDALVKLPTMAARRTRPARSKSATTTSLLHNRAGHDRTIHRRPGSSCCQAPRLRSATDAIKMQNLN